MAGQFEQEALAALQEYEAAMQAGDAAAQLAFYADDWRSAAGRTKADVAAGFENPSQAAVNATKRFVVDDAKVTVEGNVATIDPVTIRSPTGGGFMRFVLRRTAAGKWQCVSLTGSQASDSVAEQARAFRERLLADHHRPGYHFVMPEGVAMPFDPNGAIYWQGRYHLFYIFQDTQLGRRSDHWGHVSSTDLFHWRHHPTGLMDGMYSGNCFLNKAGVPTMCYHQVGKGNAMAVALDDDLNEWRKLPGAITPEPGAGGEGERRYRSWDPFGWVEGDNYYAIFGGTAPAIAKAPALEGPWRYMGDLFAHGVPGVALDEDVSCADFFRLGNVDVLLCISHRLGCRYYLGEWRGEQFHPASHGRMSWVDNAFFAPESLVDDKGRRIMWAWILDEPRFGVRRGAGWSGTLSLPRVLSLGDDGGLRMDVAEEIEALRYGSVTTASLATHDNEVAVDGIAGDSLELRVEIESESASAYGVKICASPDGQEETAILYNPQEKALQVDTRRAGPPSAPGALESAPFALRPGEPLQLRIFIDKSVVEVFANSRQAIARRIYPSRQDAVGVYVFSRSGACRHNLEAWRLAPSNPY